MNYKPSPPRFSTVLLYVILVIAEEDFELNGIVDGHKIDVNKTKTDIKPIENINNLSELSEALALSEETLHNEISLLLLNNTLINDTTPSNPIPTQESLFINKTKVISTIKSLITSPEDTVLNCSYAKGKEYHRQLVAFNQDGLNVCSGSLIRDYWVLTSAYCCKHFPNISDIRVKIRMDVMKKSIEEKGAKIDDYIIHRNYALLPLTYDVCLVKLSTEDKSVVGTKSVSKLSSRDHFEYFTSKKSCPNAVLLGYSKYKVDSYWCLPITSVFAARDCKEIPGISETMFCAIDKEKKESFICPAMSGGILLCEGIQLGVVSIPVNCARGHIPSLFTRVDIIRDFIDNTIPRHHKEAQFRSYELNSGQDKLCLTLEIALITFCAFIFTSFRL